MKYRITVLLELECTAKLRILESNENDKLPTTGSH